MKVCPTRRKTLESIALILAVVGITFSTTGSTYSAAASRSTTPPIADLSIYKATVTGGITHNSGNAFISMLFTTKNLGPAVGDAEIHYTKASGMHVLGTSCIYRGIAGGGDGDFCEFSARANQSLGTYVVYGQIGAANSGPISVTVCVDDIGGNNTDPNHANDCSTLSVAP